MDRKFVGLLTRCKDEFFIKEFCDYYLSQGVDEIYIIDDDSNDKSIYNDINDYRIIIIYEKISIGKAKIELRIDLKLLHVYIVFGL